MYSNELYAYRNKLTNNKIKKLKKTHQKQFHDMDNVALKNSRFGPMFDHRDVGHGRARLIDASYLYNIQFIWSGFSHMGDIIERLIFLQHLNL